MSLRSVCSLLVCLILLCGCVPLLCQNCNYHIKLSDGDRGQVIFVNDSKKPIEAFQVSGRCGRGFMARDALDGPSHDALEVPGDKEGIESVVVAPAGRMTTLATLVPHPSGCKWETGVDAVIYADGSYGGNETIARGMQCI